MKVQTTNNNVLILGTDPFGLMTYNAFKADTTKRFQVLGFVSIDSYENDAIDDGINVYKLNDITNEFIKLKSIDEIVISIQHIETVVFIDLVMQLLKLNVALKIIPPIELIKDGVISIDQIKNLEIDDLIFRKPKFDYNPVLLDAYQNQIIMITGAAGSIGSALASQLTPLSYKQLILIDSAESALYDVQQQLIQKGITNFVAVVADIKDYNRLDQLFFQFKPKVVLHAAAYKHVPLMEEYPYEAVAVNVVGTKNVADLSVKHSVDKFIFISTDKAVNPTNVMGASKRIAELYLQGLEGRGQTKFIITRFGNVLASNGSMIPLFKKQLASGGPITVTHRDIERYFMTIIEASFLILEAGAIGNGGEIFVFEMGKSIKVFEIAKMMIQLSNYQIDKDIEIKITGLRPGEKIVEEMLAPGEQSKSTYHEKIRIVQSQPSSNNEIQSKIMELCEKASKIQNLELVAFIKAIVPEYISNNSKFEVLDSKKRNL